MFGFERLREEVEDLKSSIDDLKDKFQNYADNEITFSEMTRRVDNLLTIFKEDFFLKHEEHFRLENITERLFEILKRFPEPAKEVKVKDKKVK